METVYHTLTSEALYGPTPEVRQGFGDCEIPKLLKTINLGKFYTSEMDLSGLE
jgi:hypothetical protein